MDRAKCGPGGHLPRMFRKQHGHDRHTAEVGTEAVRTEGPTDGGRDAGTSSTSQRKRLLYTPKQLNGKVVHADEVLM